MVVVKKSSKNVFIKDKGSSTSQYAKMILDKIVKAINETLIGCTITQGPRMKGKICHCFTE